MYRIFINKTEMKPKVYVKLINETNVSGSKHIFILR